MNTPNKLTLLRVIMVHVFMWAFLSGFHLAAIVIFVVAARTDQLDGHLARKNNQVTTFGKLMDPIADKLLTSAALVCLVDINADFMNSAVVMIVIARELIVTGIRLIALGENKVIAASAWGKAKTVSQMVTIIALMLELIIPLRFGDFCLTFWLVVIMVVLTIYSGVDYVVKNRHLITFK